MSDTASVLSPTYSRTDEKVLPIVIYALFLSGFLTAGFTAAVGVVMAYALMGRAGPLARSHYRFQTRSFWGGVVGLVIGAVVALLGVPLLLAFGLGVLFFLAAKAIFVITAIWWAVRNVIGLIRAAQDEPYPTPQGWML